MAYALMALLVRHLGPTAAAPLSMLWTWWGFVAAGIAFPIQHWLITHVGRHRADLRGAFLRIVSGSLVAAGASGLLAWWFGESLFASRSPVWALCVVLLAIGSVAVGVVGGALGARRRFDLVAVAMVSEHVARIVPSIVLLALGVTDIRAYGIVLALGSLAPLLIPGALRWPESLAIGRPVASAVVASTAVSQVLAQTVLTGAPVLLALLGGAPAEVTALFSTLAVYRAPLIIGQGILPALTSRLARGGPDRARRWTAWTAVAALPSAVLASGVALAIGNPTVALLFGDEVSLPRHIHAAVACGCCLAIFNTVAAALAIVTHHRSANVVGWGLGSAVAGIVAAGLMWMGYGPLGATAAAFAVAEIAAFATVAALLALHQRGSAHSMKASV